MFRFFAVTSPILYSQHRHCHTPAYVTIFLCWAASLTIGIYCCQEKDQCAKKRGAFWSPFQEYHSGPNLISFFSYLFLLIAQLNWFAFGYLSYLKNRAGQSARYLIIDMVVLVIIMTIMLTKISWLRQFWWWCWQPLDKKVLCLRSLYSFFRL